MSSFKYVGALLRLRYIIPATVAGGYYSAKRKLEDFKESIPELPSFMQDLNLSQHFDQLQDSFAEFIRKRNAEYLAAKQEIERNRFLKKEIIAPEQIVRPIAQTPEEEQQQRQQQQQPDDKPQISKPAARTGLLNAVFHSQASKNVEEIEKEVERLKGENRQLEPLRNENKQLRRENKELKSALRWGGSGASAAGGKNPKSNIKKSLIEIYSEVLDEMSGYDSAYKMQDHLPKVVVVGDQSAGKTSVLEMIAGARIFPRGAGEMMTRAPVQVTLSEGPYHIARFADSLREFDLTKEMELADLRQEIENRMRLSVRDGKTVSNQKISLTIQGPGIQRMVLVDLPGIISTVTTELAPDTKECIERMVTEYMGNPNAIILCIQDGSIDAERSIFTDIVREIDQAGKRTIFVLTKVDIAEQTHANPGKLKKILDGELFPMKALGYYAVVAGKSGPESDIKEIEAYEQEFFKNSALLDNGILNPSQCSTRNLSSKVSECFWSMVKASIAQQADAYKATLVNLEADWQRLFPHVRQLTRDEVFHNARNELLNGVAELSRLSTEDWDQLISSQLWARLHDQVIEKLYFPATMDKDHFNSKVITDLQRWIESHELPKLALQVARESIKLHCNEFLFGKGRDEPDSTGGKRGGSGAKGNGNGGQDSLIYQDLQRSVLNEALDRYEWSNQALERLRYLQLEAVSQHVELTKENWKSAISFLESSLQGYVESAGQQLSELTGPSLVQRWLKWRSTSHEQLLNQLIRDEFDRLVGARESVLEQDRLSEPDVITIKKNLQAQGQVDESALQGEAIQQVWAPYHKHYFLQNEIQRARDCSRMFHFYEKNLDCGIDCNHVMFFYRIRQILASSTLRLRKQFLEGELKRVNREIIEVFDEYADDEHKKAKLISGQRVELAEELVKVRQIQDKLEEFISALNQEERVGGGGGSTSSHFHSHSSHSSSSSSRRTKY